MEQQEIEQRLDSYGESLLTYGTDEFRISMYRINKEKSRLTIYTDNENVLPLEVPLNSITQFFKHLRIKTKNVMAIEKQEDKIQVTISDLKSILIENINRVKEDKEYSTQAKIVNNNVNSLINLAKLQLDVVRFQTENPS